MSSPVVIEGSIYPAFGTTKVDTGAATDADSTPTAVILDNGSAMGYAPTVSNITTGLYKVEIDCTVANGFTAGHRYTVYATATVNSITGSDQIDEFEVLANDLNTTLDAAVSSRSTYAGGAVASVTAAVTVTGTVDANIVQVNGDAVTGDGHTGTEWGPA